MSQLVAAQEFTPTPAWTSQAESRAPGSVFTLVCRITGTASAGLAVGHWWYGMPDDDGLRCDDSCWFPAPVTRDNSVVVSICSTGDDAVASIVVAASTLHQALTAADPAVGLDWNEQPPA